MKSIKTKSILLFVLFSISINFFSCKKDEFKESTTYDVTKEEAILAAQTFYEYIHDKKSNILKVAGITYQNYTTYYQIQTDEKNFMFIAADKRVDPLIGFTYIEDSIEQNFEIESPAFKDYLELINRQIVEIKSKKQASLDSNSQTIWSDIKNKKEIFVKNNNKSIVKMICTKWGQKGYFNDSCLNPCNRSDQMLVGCSAVAMGQLMKFYNHPNYTTGDINYQYNSPCPYVINQNLTKEWNYNKMPCSIFFNITINSPETNSFLAKIGASIHTEYGYESSTAYTSQMSNALQTKWGFNNTNVINRSNYSNNLWTELLKNHLDQRHPIIYMGIENTIQAGHAWVCEGYFTFTFTSRNYDLFRMNWGWSGHGDGLYRINDLVVNGYNFTNSNKIIIPTP